MRKIGVFTCLCAALVLGMAFRLEAAQDEKPDDSLAQPAKALITPGGARIEVVQTVKVGEADGKPAVRFVIPANAGNLQLSIPGQTIARWSGSPVLLNDGGPFAGRRASIEKERIEVSGKLMTVNSRLHLWQAPPKSANAQEMENLQSAMQSEMPELVARQAELEQRLKLINEELSRMPNPSDLGERIQVILAGDVKPGTELTVNYSYTHDGCGWEPVYEFNAQTGVSGSVIDVRMLAEIWQFTGINWQDTEITLATRGNGPREPAPLPEWIIDSAQPAPSPKPRAAAKTLALTAEAAGVNRVAPVMPATDSVYASWELSQKGLAQGRSRLEITSTAWKTPLLWLARPTVRSNEVWLTAKYTLPADQAWPAGLAEYSVNGQNIGSGEFRPDGDLATLFFGSDPRVSIKTVTNSIRRGDSGIINSSRSWTWSWTYTITNQRNEPIEVRVERPAPQIVDKTVTVAYKNEPKAIQEQHMLVWNVEVPAHGKKSIEHQITLTSPTKLPLLPDVP